MVWARHYGPPATYGDATPVPSFENPTTSTPVLETPFPWHIVVVVHEFDTTGNAANAFARISEGIGSMLVDDYSFGMMDLGTINIHTEALTGIGTRATLTRPDATGLTDTAMEAVTVQRDQYVYYVASYVHVPAGNPGSDDAIAALPTVEVALAIEASGARDAAEVTFRPDGTSTGGLWGFMPAPGDPALQGLVPVGDEAVYVVPVMGAMPFPQ